MKNSSGWVPYSDFDGFANVYLEDSYLRAINVNESSVALEIDAALLPGHSLFAMPPLTERHCYRRAMILLPNAKNLTWLNYAMKPLTDNTGEIDYGTIDEFYRDNSRYRVGGEWGEFEVISDPPELVVQA